MKLILSASSQIVHKINTKKYNFANLVSNTTNLIKYHEIIVSEEATNYFRFIVPPQSLLHAFGQGPQIPIEPHHHSP